MSMKLYVGNLSFNTSSDDLQELFAQAGTVESSAVVEDRETGRSRGFGFVEMSTPEEGQAAIEKFNGMEVGGRSLTVNEAKPRERPVSRSSTTEADSTVPACANNCCKSSLEVWNERLPT